MSKRSILLLIDDMLQSAQKIKKYTSALDYQSFLNDEKTKDAVIRNFEIIGEAANRIDPAFRSANNNIEWTRIRGFRNRIVHDYFGVDYEIVWSIIQNYLEDLISDLYKLHEKLRSENSDE